MESFKLKFRNVQKIRQVLLSLSVGQTHSSEVNDLQLTSA